MGNAQVQWLTRSPGSRSDEDPEDAVLPKDKLVSLCKCDPILKWMRSCDHILYQALVETLIPDVLRPVPSEQPGCVPPPTAAPRGMGAEFTGRPADQPCYTPGRRRAPRVPGQPPSPPRLLEPQGGLDRVSAHFPAALRFRH